MYCTFCYKLRLVSRRVEGDALLPDSGRVIQVHSSTLSQYSRTNLGTNLGGSMVQILRDITYNSHHLLIECWIERARSLKLSNAAASQAQM